MPINNQIYESLGERWYHAYDDPIALLRAENKIKVPWILERVFKENFTSVHLLDIGCGAGFLTNEVVQHNIDVTGVDIAEDGLGIARKYDSTGKVKYVKADAYQLPFEDRSFNVVCAMDFLEHVHEPSRVILEASRVLKDDGLFFFHTFNRNILSWLVVIKGVEWLVQNTPKDMHMFELFIKPKELSEYCENANLTVEEITGIRPALNSISIKTLLSGVVPYDLRFTLTPSTLLSYLGVSRKDTFSEAF
ncbi:MAG: bifunctional 2-polyprenyl-6-hydroxyphenol methylase/3-demethylubiquinol 3-O-methyltransferase UbiG [Bacteriovoracaceae bacterium]